VYFYTLWNHAIVAPQPGVVMPGTGPAAGGTVVSVLGLDFKPGAKVYFGGVPATGVVWVSSTQINCATPPHTAGPVTVRILNPDLAEGSLANGFTYY